MKILLVNYRYFISGGPEKYMFNIKRVLEEKGHEVIPFSVHSNRNVETEYSRYFAAKDTAKIKRLTKKIFKKTKQLINMN